MSGYRKAGPIIHSSDCSFVHPSGKKCANSGTTYGDQSYCGPHSQHFSGEARKIMLETEAREQKARDDAAAAELDRYKQHFTELAEKSNPNSPFVVACLVHAWRKYVNGSSGCQSVTPSVKLSPSGNYMIVSSYDGRSEHTTYTYQDVYQLFPALDGITVVHSVTITEYDYNGSGEGISWSTRDAVIRTLTTTAGGIGAVAPARSGKLKDTDIACEECVEPDVEPAVSRCAECPAAISSLGCALCEAHTAAHKKSKFTVNHSVKPIKRGLVADAEPPALVPLPAGVKLPNSLSVLSAAEYDGASTLRTNFVWFGITPTQVDRFAAELVKAGRSELPIEIARIIVAYAADIKSE